MVSSYRSAITRRLRKRRARQLRIISLTTIPPRFSLIGPTLDSLSRQRGKVDEIRLTIPKHYRRFPEWDGSPPHVPDRITIVRPEEDLGPASKVLFAARDLKGENAQILFCDDDVLYRPDWAERLFDAQDKRPNECVALAGKLAKKGGTRTATGLPAPRRRASNTDLEYRLRKLRHVVKNLGKTRVSSPPERRVIARAGHVDVFQGVGGVVVKPEFFDDRAYEIPPVLWTVDDFWLSGMLAVNGVPIFVPADLYRPTPSQACSIDALKDFRSEGFRRGEANRACIRYMQETFGIWRG
ncbi:glycosyltransferase family A protein [Jiella flava]|uniref:Glycosyltransferase family 2 protein n=2 Tax=Jiella flava TaxID=2816857 RepID=A0A939FZP0_9HYPH|nr:glycosyltransferase family A protein [Jiella flava]MBO0664545.1 glycosyltransferase family 2 protein [Jiella flava]